MTSEIKLKFYNSKLQIGFNFPTEVYDVVNKQWMKSKYHAGRIVYGEKRIPYKRIAAGIDKRNFIAQEFLPF